MSTRRSIVAMCGCLPLAAIAFALVGCQSQPARTPPVAEVIKAELAAAQTTPAPAAVPAAVARALIPPLTVEMPPPAKAAEPRFDVSVANARADQVFMAIVSGTPYSMVVHPDIKELVSIRLKDVTLREALDALREVYGYEYKIDGHRIYILPVSMQSRIFQVNYLAAQRVGRADLRVSSGSIQAPVPVVTPTGAPAPTTAAAAAAATGAGTPIAPSAASASLSLESSRVTTSSDNNFWSDVQATLRAIVGSEGGRSVVVNANAGVIVVRALPKELRAVEDYLNAMSLIVERQVMLEAKILEVTLDESSSTGINWAAFATGNNHRLGGGIVNPATTIRSDGSVSNPVITIDPARSQPQTPDPLAPLAGSSGSVTRRITTAAAGLASSMFGLAFQTNSFASLLTFLESQGSVHVLSSPRIATINNQKAVIKVGTDEFFVTNVQTTTVANGGSTTVSPTITTQPFFSGIALDVTPQISNDDQITLHIHPSVSVVSDKVKVIDLGTLGVFTLPLASSNINESDTIVRVQDGTIAAIGGLMRQQDASTRSGLPGSGRSPVGAALLGSRDQQMRKSELVILLKVTVIKGDSSWQAQAREVDERVQAMRR